VDHRVDYI
jgi:hypothetical protein